MNWRTAMFAAWLVFALCWSGGVGYLNFNELCATYSRADYKKVQDTILQADASSFPMYKPPSPTCFPSGELRPDWNPRISALRIVLAPPIVLLLYGLALLWVLRDVKLASKSRLTSRRHDIFH